jgi:glycosyltransferase involved in cell wall biosynthesis
MDRGGVETWLMQMLRHIDRGRFQMDFLVHTARPGAYDDEIEVLGSRVIPCLGARRPWTYAANFSRQLAAYGPYDIVHSHVDAFSGYVLMLAQRAGVAHRISHSHSNTMLKRKAARTARRVYLKVTDEAIRRYATLGLAASSQAADALFGPDWTDHPRRGLLYYGCDLDAFRGTVDPTEVRAELGIEPGEIVVGHVGRFSEPKNHGFFIDVAAEVTRLEPSARFLLLGDGPLRPFIEQRIRASGLSSRFVLTGVRSDVARLMLGAMDVLLFPSLWEGLPMTVIESQAACLPFVGSLAVPPEGVVVPWLARRMDLDEPVFHWAQAVLDAARLRAQVDPLRALGLMRESPFHVERSVSSLVQVYESLAELPIPKAA